METTTPGGESGVRVVEVFTAGCALCEQVLEIVRRLACPSCAVEIRDMTDPTAQERAREVGVRSVPAVAVDGALADCCAGRGPEEGALRAAGVGQPG